MSKDFAVSNGVTVVGWDWRGPEDSGRDYAAVFPSEDGQSINISQLTESLQKIGLIRPKAARNIAVALMSAADAVEKTASKKSPIVTEIIRSANTDRDLRSLIQSGGPCIVFSAGLGRAFGLRPVAEVFDRSTILNAASCEASCIVFYDYEKTTEDERSYIRSRLRLQPCHEIRVFEKCVVQLFGFTGEGR